MAYPSLAPAPARACCFEREGATIGGEQGRGIQREREREREAGEMNRQMVAAGTEVRMEDGPQMEAAVRTCKLTASCK